MLDDSPSVTAVKPLGQPDVELSRATQPPPNDAVNLTALDKESGTTALATSPEALEHANDVDVEKGKADDVADVDTDEEEGFEDGLPEDAAPYIEDVWEDLVDASAVEDWDVAMKLWAKLEKRLEYPQGRVSCRKNILSPVEGAN